jgi:hypothetical protein
MQKLFIKYGKTFFSSVIRYRDLIKVKTRVMSSDDINMRVLFECLANSGAVHRNQPITPAQLGQALASVFGRSHIRLFGKHEQGVNFQDVMDAIGEAAPATSPQTLTAFGLLFSKWIKDINLVQSVGANSYKFAYLSDPSSLFPTLDQLQEITIFETGLALFRKHYETSVKNTNVADLSGVSVGALVREFFYMWESFRAAFVHDSNIIVRNFDALKQFLSAIASDDDYVALHISEEMIAQMLSIGNIANYFLTRVSSTRSVCSQMQEVLAANAYRDLISALNQEGSLIQSENTKTFLLGITEMKTVTSRSPNGEVLRRVRRLRFVQPQRVDLMIGSTFAASLNPNSPMFVPSKTTESLLTEFLNNRFDRMDCEDLLDMVRESYSTMAVGTIDRLDEVVSPADASFVRFGLAATHAREIVIEPGKLVFHVDPIDDQIASPDEVLGSMDLRLMHTRPDLAMFASVPDHTGTQSIILDQSPAQYVDDRTLFINLGDRFTEFPTIGMSVRRLNGTIGHPVMRIESLLGTAQEDGLAMFRNTTFDLRLRQRQRDWNDLLSSYASELDILLVLRSRVSSYVNDCIARWKDRVLTDQLVDSQLFMGELRLTAEARLSIAATCVRYDLGLLGALSPDLLAIYQAVIEIVLANYPFHTLVSGVN